MKCECGEKIIFEIKKTFAVPNVQQGICPKCKKKYELIDNTLYKKGGE